MDKIAGVEEVLQDIGSMKRMQENRVLKYLDLLSNQFLYQKMGFLLSEHKEQMGLSDEFLREHLLLKGGTAINHHILTHTIFS